MSLDLASGNNRRLRMDVFALVCRALAICQLERVANEGTLKQDNRRFHFISGLHCSGSTLTAGI